MLRVVTKVVCDPDDHLHCVASINGILVSGDSFGVMTSPDAPSSPRDSNYIPLNCYRFAMANRSNAATLGEWNSENGLAAGVRFYQKRSPRESRPYSLPMS